MLSGIKKRGILGMTRGFERRERAAGAAPLSWVGWIQNGGSDLGRLNGTSGWCVLPLRQCEAMQLTAVMAFNGFGKLVEERQQFCSGFCRQFQRDTHDGQIVWFHDGAPQAFFGFFAARD
jgi:hypothetical protein